MGLFRRNHDHHCDHPHGRRFARHEREHGGYEGRSRRGGFGRGGRLARFLEHGDLRLLVLHLINEKPRHGYEIIKAIEDLAGGAYAPSPGVIYPDPDDARRAGPGGKHGRGHAQELSSLPRPVPRLWRRTSRPWICCSQNCRGTTARSRSAGPSRHGKPAHRLAAETRNQAGHAGTHPQDCRPAGRHGTADRRAVTRLLLKVGGGAA